MSELKTVNQARVKKDAFAIMGGGAVYTEDYVRPDALCVKLLRSPHAFARILSVDKSEALSDPDVICVLSYEDVPKIRHSYAGENFPGNNPQDRYILENLVRYVGDPVAIVAAKTEAAAELAVSRLKVEYEKLTPVLDFEHAEESPSVVHPEDDFLFQMDVGGDLSHNLLSSQLDEGGDFEAEYEASPVKLDEVYYTAPTQQSMMETFRTYSYMDEHGCLTLIGSTQVPFHVRRVVATALGISHREVRVIKPRIGGGFGAKQSLVCELYPAIVTKLTGRPAYYKMTRHESFACGNTRHAFRIRVRLGAETDGTVRALWVDSLEDAGAYGEHSVNVVGLSGHKTLPLYAKAKAWRYTGRVVYTNHVPGGAFRGFGATQGCFAVESTVNKLAERLGMDPSALRLKNLPKVGERMPAYYNEPLMSCSLDRCIETGRALFGWDEKAAAAPFARKVGPHRYRGAGMAITMQGSGLSNLETCNAAITLEDEGFYTLKLGASDIGTGSDTILSQIAVEVLNCDIDRIAVSGVDTSSSPYDKGAYASSTTYVTGNAVKRAAEALLSEMKRAAADILGVPAEALDFDGLGFTAGDRTLDLRTLGFTSVNGHHSQLIGTGSFCGTTSPPPFVAGFAEVEVDTETGKVTLCDLVGVVDCGTVVNKALALVQAEGGFAQGAGMALYENPQTAPSGRMLTDSFMDYKIPARPDLPQIRIAFEESSEPSGPFGAKSIGEVVINTPSPAIVSAIRNAVGADIRSLPATPEKVYFALKKA